MDRGRAQDLVRRGILASTAKNAFEDNLDLNGTTKGGGREYKNKKPRPGNPQPSQYSFDQPSNSPPQAGPYQFQGQGYYPQQGSYGQPPSGYGQAASGVSQDTAYTSNPQQSTRPPSCTCTLCQHCTGHFADCFNQHSQLYYCRHHRGCIMTWTNPGMRTHDCPSKYSPPPPPNQYSYSAYEQRPSTTRPSYGSGSGQGYGGATRDVYLDSAPRSLTEVPYQGSPPPDYMLGGGYTQEPTQLPDGGVAGEASSYYGSSQYPPAWPRVRAPKTFESIRETDVCGQ